MDEFWNRMALVGGALIVAGAVALWQRRRSRRPIRDLGELDMPRGLYFFSSASCPTCRSARRKIESAVGLDGFTEYVWEREPGLFADLEVDAVPAVLVVDELGRGRLYPGQPERALQRG